MVTQPSTKPAPEKSAFPTELPSLLDFEKKDLSAIHKKLETILERDHAEFAAKDIKRIEELQAQLNDKLKTIHKNLSNWQRTQIARHPKRPYALDYIHDICDEFIEISGDRLYRNDEAIVGGMATFAGRSVVMVGQQKGRSTEENIRRNFGMPHPEGYRKALRLFKLADKFHKPIITFIDTPGAYHGAVAEERGQAAAIAENLQAMFSLHVPIIAVVIGEGGSGGALALSVADSLFMLENSIYSVISPESCAAILWKNEAHKEEAANALRNDAFTAKQFGIIDEIVKEAPGGAHRGRSITSRNLRAALIKTLDRLSEIPPNQLTAQRIEKFAEMGVVEKI